jgi:ribosomal subunit interface protein
MEIIVRGRHLAVPSRFRQHAVAKLTRLEKLDHKVEQIDVEISAERNPRQSDRRERVELTIRSRGPAIRAEAAAEDRYAALDLALAKLEARLRRAGDRRKTRHSEGASVRSPAQVPAAVGATPSHDANGAGAVARPRTGALDDSGGDMTDVDDQADDLTGAGPRMIPIEMEGDGPVVLREKVHAATPMTIDQALLEMELVGHDFYLFRDVDGSMPSVVYRRRGYQYGVIRLVDAPSGAAAASPETSARNGRRDGGGRAGQPRPAGPESRGAALQPR